VFAEMRRLWAEQGLPADVLGALGNPIDEDALKSFFPSLDFAKSLSEKGERATDEELQRLARSVLVSIRGHLHRQDAAYVRQEERLRAMVAEGGIKRTTDNGLRLVSHVEPYEYGGYGLTPTTAVAPFAPPTYLDNTPLGATLQQTAKYSVRGHPDQLVVFHGTTMDCEAGLCKLLIHREGTMQSSIQKLGPGFYVTTSVDEALSYACARAQERRRGTGVVVLEIVIDRTDTIVSVPKPASTAIPDTRTFVRNTKTGYHNQICVHNGVLGLMRVVGIHTYTNGAFRARDTPLNQMGTQGGRTKFCAWNVG
jgi:hypothetical protein